MMPSELAPPQGLSARHRALWERLTGEDEGTIRIKLAAGNVYGPRSIRHQT